MQTFFRCIHEVSSAICDRLSAEKIKFPNTRREINENKELFMEKFGFPGVIGAIDCTHVAILKPQDQEHAFINRKGYHSLNVQIVCDANLLILGINANYPGSCHDSFIWRQTLIRDHLMHLYANGLRRSWLIGDSGYPLEPILMTPFLNPLEGSPESRYNNCFVRARNVVERCIGVLKMRFRCLAVERRARYAPDKMGKIILACAILHNMCVNNHLEFPYDEVHAVPEFPRADGHAVVQNNNLLNEARIIRQNIVENYFRN